MGTTLVEKMLAGDRLSLSRLISEVENRGPEHVRLMALVQERCGRAHVVGVTGPPGSGKSTLVDGLIERFRREGKTVGVVAIDPSSPFSGGAVLGDRIRMQGHSGDEGVFIRSLGSRGSHGGLSRATREVVKLYDAYGMDWILVETVGVGQTELDIMELAGTTIVLLTPESGDAIQTLKAGILEIADLFCVNKADREGADRMQAELKSMIEIGGGNGRGPGGWSVPVLAVQAAKGIGIEEVVSAIEDHRAYLRAKGLHEDRRRKVLLEEIREILADELQSGLESWLKGHERALSGNPYRAAQGILGRMKLWGGSPVSTRRPPRSSARSRRAAKGRSKRR